MTQAQTAGRRRPRDPEATRRTSAARSCAWTGAGFRAKGIEAMIVKGEAGDRYRWAPITLAQQLATTAAAHPDRDALVFGDRRLSWAQTQAEVTRVARALLAAGVRRGDHVAVWVPNHIEWILLWLGANSIGAVIVAVNTRYKTEEVEYILGQSDAKLLVMVDEFVGIDYLAMLARLRAADLPGLRRVVVIGNARGTPSRGTSSSTRVARTRSTWTRSPTTTRASSSTRAARPATRRAPCTRAACCATSARSPRRWTSTPRAAS
jgi:acyl-CoA synthetase (AMP-forming)/AMP-acid ligase II